MKSEHETKPQLPIGVLLPSGGEHGAFEAALEEEERRLRAQAFLERVEARQTVEV
jgi:hypothetical protein